MKTQALFTRLLNAFPHSPTESQTIVLQQLSEFLIAVKNKNSVFILKGFAGTGKTTIISLLVNFLKNTSFNVVLLAPTGRASKIISGYSNQKAYTIHKHIYYPKTENQSVAFQLKNNKEINTFYIVDEASMISNEASFEQNSVLADLFSYVYSAPNSKLILVGDTAQLPPVHSAESLALNEDFISFEFGKEVHFGELTQVVRQEKKSGILHNATLIRKKLTDFFYDDFQFEVHSFNDIFPLWQGDEIQDALYNSYQKYGITDTLFIVRSNKRAVLYNRQIRKVILENEEELSVGDLLMVVKNNYFWIDPKTEAGFIANGDILEIIEIHAFEELYGFEFAQVKVKMTDYPEQPPFNTIIFIGTLHSETPSLSYEENQQLYQALMQEYSNESSKYKKYQKIKNNPYFNALQVKYSYAVTCHKSQGGQWSSVFIEKPFLPEGITEDYLRWLYTAITRAKKQVYLINFEQHDFLFTD